MQALAKDVPWRLKGPRVLEIVEAVCCHYFIRLTTVLSVLNLHIFPEFPQGICIVKEHKFHRIL